MSLLVMAGLLMTEKVYRLINLVVEQRLRLSEVGLMLIYLLPQVLSLTLPLAVLSAVFITVIRQSMDSEVISMRATGKALWNYALPFMGFGLIVSLIAAVLILWIQPLATRKYHDLQVEMVRWRAEEKLVPGRLNHDFGDKVIRIGGRNAEKDLTGIFIADRRLGEEASVITASTGRIDVDQATRQVVFRLRDGMIYSMGRGGPGFRTVQFGTLRYVLEYAPAQTYTQRNIRSVPTSQLVRSILAPESSPHQRINYNRELQRRLASPWAALAFALASIPMALVDPRSGRRAGYLRGIFLAAAYFIIWTAFKNMVTGRQVPAEAMWLPAMMVFAYGSLRLWQMNADIESLWRGFRRR